jgi:hypothetical protein
LLFFQIVSTKYRAKGKTTKTIRKQTSAIEKDSKTITANIAPENNEGLAIEIYQ